MNDIIQLEDGVRQLDFKTWKEFVLKFSIRTCPTCGKPL